MKKILGILVLGLLLGGNAYAFGTKIGKGEIKFSNKTLNYFIKYLEHLNSKTFIVSEDGNYSNFSICTEPSSTGRGCHGGVGSTNSMIKRCKKLSGVKCYVFAMTKRGKNTPIRKIIRWNNINHEFQFSAIFSYGRKKNNFNHEEVIKVLEDLKFL